MGEWMGRRMDGWMVGWLGGCIDEWMVDRCSISGWVDEWVY